MNKNESVVAYLDWTAVGMTNPGLVRENNEDAYYCDDEQGLYIVIDGMGGHRAGEVAARIALETLQQELSKKERTQTKERIRQAIIAANNMIIEQSEMHQEWRNMQCVLTVAMLEDNHIVIGHVGDTRLYKISADAIRKVTHDHSPSGILEEVHHMSELEAMQLPNRNEVYRSLGAEYIQPNNYEFVELLTEPVMPNESILLCSDGLSDCLTSEHIREIIRQHKPYSASIVNHLIQAANMAGGKDNITVIYAQKISSKQAVHFSNYGKIAKVAAFCSVLLLAAILWFMNPFADQKLEEQIQPATPVSNVSSPQSNAATSDSVSIYDSTNSQSVAQGLKSDLLTFQQNKSNSDNYYQRGLLLKKQKNLDEAAKYFMIALLLDKDKTAALKEYCSIKKIINKTDWNLTCPNE
jgi:serine/threonine protein phosphatase PrpC